MDGIMKYSILLLLILSSLSVRANGTNDENPIIGTWKCYDHGLERSMFSVASYSSNTFHQKIQSSVMIVSTGEVLTFETTVSGKWNYAEDRLEHTIEAKDISASNELSEKYLAIVKEDLNINSTSVSHLHSLEDRTMKLRNSRAGFTYCFKQ